MAAMTANIQRLISLGLIGAVIAWASYFMQRGEPTWAWTGALLLIFGYALFLAAEFVLLALTWDETSVVPSPSAAQLIGAWCGEVITAPLVFCWRQPFRTFAQADFTPSQSPGQRGVVMVHGFFCNRALWNPWMAKLRAAGTPFVAVSLEPVFGSIDHYPQTIDAAVRQIEAATGLAPVVVAHSMGGLATRAWLAKNDNDARVHRVITIGTPHHGTWLARFGHTRNARQMRIKSDWLQQLAASEPPSRYARFTCFFSHCDNIVFPASTATLPGAQNRHVPGTAHVHLAFRQQVFAELQHWLGRSPAVVHREATTATSRSAAYQESGERPG